MTGLRVGQPVVVPYHISCGECERCLRGLVANCATVPPLSMYGFGRIGGPWGGALADLVRVPFAEHMLVPIPDGIDPASVAAIGDNLTDGYRTVGPQLKERPGSPVLVLGGTGSIGLYATAVALALGAERVDYVDVGRERLDLADSLGAKCIEGRPLRLGPYAITVDASADAASLACALRSTEPGGTCTSVGIYWRDTPLPLLEMYLAGVTFRTGPNHARAWVPAVLALVREGRLRPEAITTAWVDWADAAEALCEPSTKTVVRRLPSS